jgi:chromosome segregation ATPase
MEPTSHEVAALRIQAAAVVAQQAAVFEDEARLRETRLTFEQQHTQLANILEDKRLRLVSVRDEVQSARAALELEQTKFQACVTESSRHRDLELAEIADEHTQLRVERARLARLRIRLRKRLHRHWAKERALVRMREADLRKRACENERETARLAAERETLGQMRLRLNGEIEIARREIASTRQATQLERERLTEKAADLARRERVLGQAQQAFFHERQNGQRELVRLQKESAGLTSRIENQRGKLFEWERHAFPPVNPAEPVSVPASGRHTVEPTTSTALLENITDALADQRLSIVEQWQRLLHTREAWTMERDAASAQLSELARAIQERERAVESAETDLRARLANCHRQRNYVQGLQGKWTVRVSAWHGERERLLSDLRAREESVAQQQSAIGEVLAKWQDRYREASLRLKAAFAACQQAREEYAGRRDEWVRRLENRAAGDTADAIKTVIRDELAGLESESIRADDSFAQLKQWSDELAARDAELVNLLTTVENAHHCHESDISRLRGLLAGVQAQARSYERQIHELQDEVERMAELLMDAGDGQPDIVSRAA